MAKKNVIKIKELWDFRLGQWGVSNHVTLELRGSNTKGTEVEIETELPVWWFDDIARKMWQIIQEQQKHIDELKSAMKNGQIN